MHCTRMELYEKTAFACSKKITRAYSTSFSLGIRALAKPLHDPIYGIYGFVRYADEIVDSFTKGDKQRLLADFRLKTYEAIETGISTNPVLHAFRAVVERYQIPGDLIEAFFTSMAMDLNPQEYDEDLYKTYIYGSAEVVGLMCLCVFLDGDTAEYARLKPNARSLGAAFQKVNFLRDVRADYLQLGRVYFPGVDLGNFSSEAKAAIEADIDKDFQHAYEGIRQLPRSARWGVYLAYVYYRKLFAKIQGLEPARILHERVRISNPRKMSLLVSGYVNYQFKVA